MYALINLKILNVLVVVEMMKLVIMSQRVNLDWAKADAAEKDLLITKRNDTLTVKHCFSNDGWIFICKTKNNCSDEDL